MAGKQYDIVIIGAGVIGCAIARELMRYKLSVLVVDRESDICEGTSKANSAIIHGGFDALPGTMKARFNVEGNFLMDDISRELDIPFKRNGAMVVCREEEGIGKLKELMARGEANGVKGMELLTRKEALRYEPSLADGVYAAISIPSSGIVCPFEMTLGYAENALENGAQFSLSTEVTDISVDEENIFTVATAKGGITSGMVINCAGVYADRIHDMVCPHEYTITARKGEYLLLDKTAGDTVSHTIFQLPSAMGKGVLVTPTVHGNLLVGPTAENVEDKEDISTSREGLVSVKARSAMSVKDIPYNQVITSFSGLRASGDTGDFIIREDEYVRCFIDVAAIESPGLSSAPAIGQYVKDLVNSIISPEINPDFDPIRRGITHVSEMSYEDRCDLIKKDPSYGQIVCRCESISEGEILESIRRPLGATTLDGVKRRVRAGMGRCQGGFCSPRVMELLSDSLGISYEEIRKNG